MTKTMYDHIYPEICLNNTIRWLPTQPKFPVKCPVCKGKRISFKNGILGEALYACGGTYTRKPQIQCHTAKWWGSCPVQEKISGKD